MISGTYIPLANPNVKKNTTKKELSLNLILIVKNIYIFQKSDKDSHAHSCSNGFPQVSCTQSNVLASVVHQNLDSAIHRINHYPVDKY